MTSPRPPHHSFAPSPASRALAPLRRTLRSCSERLGRGGAPGVSAAEWAAFLAQESGESAVRHLAERAASEEEAPLAR